MCTPIRATITIPFRKFANDKYPFPPPVNPRRNVLIDSERIDANDRISKRSGSNCATAGSPGSWKAACARFESWQSGWQKRKNGRINEIAIIDTPILALKDPLEPCKSVRDIIDPAHAIARIPLRFNRSYRLIIASLNNAPPLPPFLAFRGEKSARSEARFSSSPPVSLPRHRTEPREFITADLVVTARTPRNCPLLRNRRSFIIEGYASRREEGEGERRRRRRREKGSAGLATSHGSSSWNCENFED